VLIPWFEVDPEGEIPGKGFIADLLADVNTSGIRKREDLEILL
jgi:2-amino-4-hydroxy-6-hydroxymethyldihydropteridine diphosphokinase